MIALIATYLPVLILLIAAGVIGLTSNVTVADLTRDATAVAEVPWHTGALSTVGLLLWSAAATLCLFTAALVRNTSGPAAQSGRFLLYSGLLTLVLLVDDAFLVHETVAPEYLGISARSLFTGYALAAIAIFWLHRKSIADSHYLLLLLAIALLAAGVVADELHDRGLLERLGVHRVGVHYLLEDGCKLLGIAGWLAYYVSTCYRTLEHRSNSTALG